jgi:hypothetical protein
MFGRLLCSVFGHKPEDYSYTSGITEYDYTECTRCNARKNLSGRGWIHNDNDDE